MFPKRVTTIAVLFALMLGGVCIQLIRLQLVQGTVYAELAREGRVWDELTAAPRGRILDSQGEVLASDCASYGLAVVARSLPLQGVRLDDIRSIRRTEDASERKLLRDTIARRLGENESAVAALSALCGIERTRLAAGLLKALERAIRYGAECCPRTIDILDRHGGVIMDPNFTDDDLKDIVAAIRKVYMAMRTYNR